MLTDYHMHPTITQEPERFDEFAHRAIQKGIKEICITDHMPLSISSAADRIPAGRVKEYCQNVRQAARKYEGILGVKLGIEIDYHPDFIGEIESVLSDGDFDYVLGSTHMHLFLKDRLDGSITKNEFARLALENTLSAVESGYFDTIAHLDMFRWVFEKTERYLFCNDDYRVEDHIDIIANILDAMRLKNVKLEINPHLAESKQDIKYVYPQDLIVKMALDRNIQFQYGSDAHMPQSVGAMLDILLEHELYGRALSMRGSEI